MHSLHTVHIDAKPHWHQQTSRLAPPLTQEPLNEIEYDAATVGGNSSDVFSAARRKSMISSRTEIRWSASNSEALTLQRIAHTQEVQMTVRYRWQAPALCTISEPGTVDRLLPLLGGPIMRLARGFLRSSYSAFGHA